MNLPIIQPLLTKYASLFSYGPGVRPHRDWYLLISIAAVLLVAFAGWSYLLFQKTSSSDTASTVSAPLTSVNAVTLETVRSVFDSRAVERNHYLSDYHFVDPSR